MTDKKDSKIEIKQDSSDVDRIKKILELAQKKKEESEKKNGRK